MEERLAAQIGVDQGGDDADLGAAQPEPDVLRAVVHEESDAVAGLEPAPEEEVRHAVGELLQVGEGPRLVLEDEGGAVGEPLGGVPEGPRHGHVALLTVVHEEEQPQVSVRTPGERTHRQDHFRKNRGWTSRT